MEIQLKHELVARGMTVDEIVRVVQATSVSDGEGPSESDDPQPASI
jgi:hypothetical protein